MRPLLILNGGLVAGTFCLCTDLRMDTEACRSLGGERLATSPVPEFRSQDSGGGMEEWHLQVVFRSCRPLPKYVNIKLFLKKRFSKRPMLEELPIQYLHLVLFDFHKATNNLEMELKVAWNGSKLSHARISNFLSFIWDSTLCWCSI